MWVERTLKALRQRRTMSIAACAVLVIAAIGLKFLLPDVPPLITLFPAVLLTALIGGVQAGAIAVAVCAVAAYYFLSLPSTPITPFWRAASLAGFLFTTVLIVFIMNMLERTILKLAEERRRLDAVLKAGNAATWELRPDGRLLWDENFYRLVGLDPAETPPSTEQFLSMVVEEDRPRMAAARDLMSAGEHPPGADEYRLMRPDGQLVWLVNHRIPLDPAHRHFMGITIDITRLKMAEEQTRMLLRELSHRVKNQYAIISSIARETAKNTTSVQTFDELFRQRMLSMAASHDLLVKGGGSGADLRALAVSQLEGFGATDRVELDGPDLTLNPQATQYIGMAFHELATNASKHGALSVPNGKVRLSWIIEHTNGESSRVAITWAEHGSPAPAALNDKGFGSTVLLRLTPAATKGQAHFSTGEGGIAWHMTAPLGAITDETASS